MHPKNSTVLFFLVGLLVVAAGCGSDKPTTPPDNPDDGLVMRGLNATNWSVTPVSEDNTQFVLAPGQGDEFAYTYRVDAMLGAAGCHLVSIAPCDLSGAESLDITCQVEIRPSQISPREGYTTMFVVVGKSSSGEDQLFPLQKVYASTLSPVLGTFSGRIPLGQLDPDPFIKLYTVTQVSADLQSDEAEIGQVILRGLIIRKT